MMVKHDLSRVTSIEDLRSLNDKGRMAGIPLFPEAKITVERRGEIVLIGMALIRPERDALRWTSPIAVAAAGPA
jgi:hypothetical protein